MKPMRNPVAPGLLAARALDLVADGALGLFLGTADTVLVADGGAVRELRRRKSR